MKADNNFSVINIFACSVVMILMLCRKQKMEDSKASPSKCQKTDFYDSDKSSKNKVASDTFLQGSRVHILEAGIGKVRSKLFRAKTSEFGGTLCSSISDGADILVVDEQMTVDRLIRLLKVDGPQHLEGVTVVYSTWLSTCIKEKKRLPTEKYRLSMNVDASSVTINSSTSQQPKLPQTVMPECSKNFLPTCPDEGLDADSNRVESGEEHTEDDSIIVNSEATIPHRRPLPVSVLFYSYFHLLRCIDLIM